MTESGLATFRIEKERWARFQQLAKDSNSNASKLIISFIDACLDNRIDISDYTITQPKSAISTSGIDDYLDNHLDTRIDSYLKKNLSSYLDNRIDNLATKELIKTALDPVRDSISKSEDVASHEVIPADAIATPTIDLEPTKLSFRDFCKHYGIKTPDGMSNQPPKAVVDKYIAQVESMGHYGWSWKGTSKHLIRATESA